MKMSAEHEHETMDENDTITPISEWPISTSDCFPMKRKHDGANLSSECASDISNEESGGEKRHKNSINCYSKSRPKSQSEVSVESRRCEEEKQHPSPLDNAALREPTIAAKIARWWRQKKVQGFDYTIPKCGPNSMVHHISRLPECRSFLQRERKRLLTLMDLPGDRADKYALLASLDDYIGSFSSALTNIEQAVQLEPLCKEYLWLKKKISKQCRVLKEQADAKERIDKSGLQFPSINEVPRVSGKNLSVSDFVKNYLEVGKPVIITDVVNEMMDVPFDYTLVMKHAGKTAITTKEAVSDSLTWARLESKRDTTVTELIHGIHAGDANEVLFDWSLPLHCPSLAELISLPEYFKYNYLLQTTPGSLYRDSWPSLFIAPKGATTQLHVDAFHSHFWMALFQGEKRWTFFDEKDIAFLYPQWFQSMDPVFDVDLTQLDLKRFPLLALTRPQQCVLQKGELLFVPAGSPHFVENLTPSLAISSNYVDHSNIQKVCEELKVNALQDPRAGDLLSQLEERVFTNTLPSQDNS